MSEETGRNEIHLELTADIVSAYVSNNPIPANDLASLIARVSDALSGLGQAVQAAELPLTPAINPKRSVHDDHIVCLEDGKKFKSLKRHLSTYHGMTPDEYRSKWGLAHDYPMVAPGYSASRSALAKKMGLGRKPAAQIVPKPVSAKKGRKPKATA